VPENAYELRKSDLKVRREMQAEVEKGWPEKPWGHFAKRAIADWCHPL